MNAVAATRLTQAIGAGRSGRTPRYAILARDLQAAIASGRYAVGCLLPTELELAASHGVSRQTVRQAIAQLRSHGLLSARKGVGTRVEGSAAPELLTYSALSAADLVEVAAGSVLTIERSDWITARGQLAADLGCRSNRRFLRLTCHRATDETHPPFAAVSTYIDGAIAQKLTLPDVHHRALFLLVEEQSGEFCTEIQQQIRATILDEDLARRLKAQPGTPALQISRRFYAAGRRLVLAAVNTMPADRFFYSVEIQRDVRRFDRS